MSKLPLEFYLEKDVVQISKNLLGKFLLTNFDNFLTGGMIVETEAYCGKNDKASHAFRGKTPRNEMVFAKGGVGYVYICYGIHHLFNVVTNQENQADAVLIRGLEPKIGVEKMLERRKMSKLSNNICAGPGSLSQALGISVQNNGVDLLGNQIWIGEYDIEIPEDQIIESTRVGVESAEESALFNWRFRIKGNRWSSKAK